MAEQVTDATFENLVLKSDIPVLLDFWAPWCGPCRAVGPIIDDLAAEYEGRVRIYKMNVDENPATPTKFGIRAIPTLILFNKGDIVEQITGAVTKAAMTEMIETKALAENA
ncbi:thioredoxin [Deltaproteobacteria bacterium]|nr:thioredoxin [Deltaproteobacteria bacterium]